MAAISSIVTRCFSSRDSLKEKSVAYDFAALNAVRHSRRNRQETHVAPAGSAGAKAEVVHRVIHKGVGMVVAGLAGAIDSGAFWKGGMPEIGPAGNGVGLDILGGFGGSVFELVALWRGMKLGYAAPVVSGASDALLFYWSGKQGQLYGAKKRAAGAASTTGTGTGFDYALPSGQRNPPAHQAGQPAHYVFDPLHGFAAQ
jgi:hypothetical protein